MPKTALTERAVRDAKPGPKAYTTWGGGGFGLRVYPSGSKAYVLKYRDAAGKQHIATLGPVETVTLKEARAAAETVKASGADPAGERREAKAAPTVADCVARFLGEFSEGRIKRGRMTESTRREYHWQATKYVLPALGSRKVASIERRDIERLVETMPATLHNRVLALCSRVLNLAAQWGHRGGLNPCKGIERARETPRDRVFSDNEMARLMAALRDRQAEQPVAVGAIVVAALSGLRISEVLSMEWANLDESGRVLLPATKTGRRFHDLPDAALAVMASLPRPHGNPHVFASLGQAGAGAAVGYRLVSNVFRQAAATAGVRDARLHDLRRGWATRAVTAGLSLMELRDAQGWKTVAMPARYVALSGELARDNRRKVGDEIAALL